MQPPVEIVFRDCDASDVINKLRAIGCEIECVDERGLLDPYLDASSHIVTQSISLTLNGVDPFGCHPTGPYLAWTDDDSDCRLVYVPSNAPNIPTMDKIFRFVLSPIVGFIDIFRGPRQHEPTEDQLAFDAARRMVVESLESDPSFLRRGMISVRDFRSSRTADNHTIHQRTV